MGDAVNFSRNAGTVAGESDFIYRSVGPIQLVSVLSISRRIRSCSAAVSTLAIMHVALDGCEFESGSAQSWGAGGLVWHPCVMDEELEGWFDDFTEQPE